MVKPLHLIKIVDGDCGTACGVDWRGAKLTGDAADVTCERCFDTEFYKKKKKKKKRETK